jgi:hypothetical protein
MGVIAPKSVVGDDTMQTQKFSIARHLNPASQAARAAHGGISRARTALILAGDCQNWVSAVGARNSRIVAERIARDGRASFIDAAEVRDC